MKAIIAQLLMMSPIEEGWETESDDFTWTSAKKLWRKRLRRFQNGVNNAIYPVPLNLFWALKALIFSMHFGGVDLPLHSHVVSCLPFNEHRVTHWIACVLLTLIAWIFLVMCVRSCTKFLLSYRGWLNEERGRGSVSLQTKLWFGCLKLLTVLRKPKVYNFQGVLPRLWVPSVDNTIQRYLQSIRPLRASNQYTQMEKLANEFKTGISNKLQRYLVLKSWWSSNYVTDWWEEYAYLRSRSPLIINSNFYAFDCLEAPSKNQAARAATMIHASLRLRRKIERQELEPVLVQGMIPLCMAQLERIFNTSRVPGEEVDKIVHYTYSKHIVVYHMGSYYKVLVYSRNRLLYPSEIEIQMAHILKNCNSESHEGEEKLGALTAGDRSVWAKARREFFSQGINRASLHDIEKAAIFVVLDDFPYEYHELQNADKLEAYGRALFHGKGYDRWFDKSITLCFGTDGRMGLNAEHSWADGAIMALYFEYLMLDERMDYGYTEEGHCLGNPEFKPPLPTRLHWDLPPPALAVIDQSYKVALVLIEDIDLRIHLHREFGKGLVKTFKVSPDAFIQMALQLAYFRDIGSFGLTYESGTTRLYLEGRTETVRSCSEYSVTWVQAMQDSSVSVIEKVELLRKACQHHQRTFQDVMCGKAVDRHLFCLYIVARYLQEDSPFLNEVLRDPWLLSTSQSPHGQTPRADLKKYPETICGGGGFGPATDDGYGVSYILGGEDIIFLHVSSKKSSTVTDSGRFLGQILQALADMRSLFKQLDEPQK